MLPRMTAYINDNPRRLTIKRAHPDYFRVRFDIEVAGQTYAAIGNRFLLHHPEKVQVQLFPHPLGVYPIQQAWPPVFRGLQRGPIPHPRSLGAPEREDSLDPHDVLNVK